MPLSTIDDPRRGWTKGMPNHFLAGTAGQLDPTRCPHYVWKFQGTFFKDDYRRHSIIHRFACKDCGKIHDVPRDVRSAGKSGSIDLEDPRVKGTLRYNDDVAYLLYGDRSDRRYIGRGMEGGTR